MDKFKKAWKYIFNGHFMVSFVRWMTLTGGNVAESAFLLATLWVTINAVAHPLLAQILPTTTIEVVNYLAITAFSIVPELIIIPLIITCYSHWSLFVRRRNKSALLWSVLFTVPALVFLVVTVTTIASFVSAKGTIDIQLNGAQLVIRCLSGWWFSTVNMLFAQAGKQQYADMLDSKDEEIKRLEEKIKRQKLENEAELNELKSGYSIQVEELLIQIKEQNQQLNRLSERASSLSRDTLENYPIVAIDWVENGKRTVSIDELIAATRISKQKIAAAIRSGKLQKDNRNKDLIRVSSVIEWLKSMPMPEPVIVNELPNDLPEDNRKIAKIIPFHSSDHCSQNGA